MPSHNRILIVRPDRIGDVVLCTPLIRALRHHYPAAYLAAMVTPYTADVLRGNPHLDEVIIDAPEDTPLLAQAFGLRKRRFDTALLLLPTKRHAWMLFFAGIRTRVGVGQKPYQVLTFMKSVSRRKYIPLRHEADYCADLGRAIGVKNVELRSEVFVSEDERVLATKRIGASSDKTVIGIHPGSGHSAPNWRPERYAELAGMLLEDPDTHIVITGSPGERELVAPFERFDTSRVINLVGELTLRETMAVIANVDVLVSASTGTMHIAAGLGVPTVSMFCPLPACSPELWGPLGNKHEIVLPEDGFCQGECPGDPHVCKFEIPPADVMHRVITTLGVPRPAS